MGEPCVQLKIKRRDPVTGETTPLTCAVGGDTFRMLLKGELFFIVKQDITCLW